MSRVIALNHIRKLQNTKLRTPGGKKYFQQGLSLIELLIATGLGIFMMTGIVSLVVSMSQTRIELDKTSEQIENGRYAIQLLSDELHNAGFYGVPSPSPTVLTTPDPCATSATMSTLEFGFIAGTPSVIKIPVPVYGYAAGTGLPTCLTNAVVGSEALVVRQVGATKVAVADIGSPASTPPYIQISANLLESPDTTQSMATGTTLADFPLHNKDGAIADVWPYRVRTFYLSSCDDCANNDGIPTLRVAEMSGNTIQVQPLVEGVEDIHFQYGIDLIGSDTSPTTPDGTPDCYVDDPGVAAAPSSCSVGTWTAVTNNWVNVTSVKIHVLARSIEPTASWTDERTYDLGRGLLDRSGPFNDHFKRQVYTVTVNLNNVSGARE